MDPRHVGNIQRRVFQTSKIFKEARKRFKNSTVRVVKGNPFSCFSNTHKSKQISKTSVQCVRVAEVHTYSNLKIENFATQWI